MSAGKVHLIPPSWASSYWPGMAMGMETRRRALVECLVVVRLAWQSSSACRQKTILLRSGADEDGIVGREGVYGEDNRMATTAEQEEEDWRRGLTGTAQEGTRKSDAMRGNSGCLPALAPWHLGTLALDKEQVSSLEHLLRDFKQHAEQDN